MFNSNMKYVDPKVYQSLPHDHREVVDKIQQTQYELQLLERENEMGLHIEINYKVMKHRAERTLRYWEARANALGLTL